MTEHSFVRCEAVKTAYRQTKEGMVVSFAIHPNEMPSELALAPVGTRVLLAVAELRDDATANDAPVPADAPPFIGVRTASVEGTPDAVPGRGRSETARENYRYNLDDMQKAVVRASLLCKDPEFQNWMESLAPDAWMSVGPTGRSAETIEALRHILGIRSRSEIASNQEAYRKFRDLEFEFRGHAEQRG